MKINRVIIPLQQKLCLNINIVKLINKLHMQQFIKLILSLIFAISDPSRRYPLSPVLPISPPPPRVQIHQITYRMAHRVNRIVPFVVH